MFKKILITLVTIVVLVLLYATTKSNTFRVERSADIKAPADKVFNQIADLHNWAKWSPYEDLDHNMKKTFSGPEKGRGAEVAWEGEGKAGKGKMIITDISEPNKIIFKLNMEKPMKALNTVEFTLNEKNGVTHVSWEMYGPKNYVAKVMSIFMNCDKMIGQQFEKGLENLKAVSEKK